MKRLLLLISVVMMFANAHALDFDLPKANVGVRGSFLSSYNMLSDDATVFVMPGLAFDVKVGEIPLYIESGAYWTRLNYVEERYAPLSSNSSLNGTYYCNDNTLMVPLLVSWHFGFENKLVLQPFLGFVYGYGFNSDKSYGGLRLGCGLSCGMFYTNIGLDCLGIFSSSNHSGWLDDGLGSNYSPRSRNYYRPDDWYDDCDPDYGHDWDCDWHEQCGYNGIANVFITVGLNFSVK